MSKRFTDSVLWEKEWFTELSPAEKCAWFYIKDRCDPVGVWEPSFTIANFYIGEKIDWEAFRSKCNGNISVLENGKWWLVDFCLFQYGILSEVSTSKTTIYYIKMLIKHGLWDRVKESYPKGIDTLSIAYPKTIHSLKEKEKDKDKEKGKEDLREKRQSEYSQDFLAFYDAYPRKEGKTQAAKTYNAKIKQGVDPAAILASLAVYKAQIVQKHTEPQYIKQPSTFLNCFEDYTPQPVPKMVRPLTFVFKSGKTCPYCKTELPKGGYLCPNCGAGPINAFNGMRDEYFEVLA